MRRGTTPTIVINVIGETFQGSKLYVTLEQKEHELTKTGEDVVVTVTGENTSTVAVYLTQQETLAFSSGPASVQIRWIDSGGTAQASPIKKIDVDPILLEGEIEYGD